MGLAVGAALGAAAVSAAGGPGDLAAAAAAKTCAASQAVKIKYQLLCPTKTTKVHMGRITVKTPPSLPTLPKINAHQPASPMTAAEKARQEALRSSLQAFFAKPTTTTYPKK